MPFRAAWLVLALAGIAGCDLRDFPYRGPCPEGETCCPPGSHEVYGDSDEIVCAADETADAGADGRACDDASTDAP